MDPYAKQARLASIAGLNSDTVRTSEPTTWDVTLRIRVEPGDNNPWEWNWRDLLDGSFEQILTVYKVDSTSGALQFPTCECGCADRQEQCIECGDDIEFQDEVWLGLQPFHPSCAPNQND